MGRVDGWDGNFPGMLAEIFCMQTAMRAELWMGQSVPTSAG